MTYTVKQLATISGVTPRTLRFYDRIGLLRPASVGANGYRAYGAEELVRLQQVLFFRELDYPLADIRAMLGRPGFDALESLRHQRRLLELKRKRLTGILKTIDSTITHMQDDTKPTDRDLYGSLSTEEIEAYKKEAKERWGHTDAYRQSQERAAKMTKADWAQMQAESDANLKALVALMEAGKTPDSPEVQAEIARHHAGIGRFYDCAPAMYRNLGDMYLADQRFADTYRKWHPDLPEFLVKGIHAFCDRQEGKN